MYLVTYKQQILQKAKFFFNGEIVDKNWAVENVPLATTQVIGREIMQMCLTQYFRKQASME